jgi:hypothetical protein
MAEEQRITVPCVQRIINVLPAVIIMIQFPAQLDKPLMAPLVKLVAFHVQQIITGIIDLYNG